MTRTQIDIRRILCPVDFSESSARALEHAVRVASVFEATVHLVHVLPRLADFADAIVVPLSTPPDRSREKVMEGLAQLAAEVDDWHVHVEPSVLTGNPAREIEAMAADLPADLIVMGTRGRTGLSRAVVGSVAEKVMFRAACPVLAVGQHAGEAFAPPYRRILCPTDLTRGSEHSLDFALALAAENDAEIEVLHVVEAIALDPDAGHSLDSDEEVRALRRRLIGDAEDSLRKAIPPDMRRWCRVRPRVCAGEASPAILQAARTGHADLIVMGAHARRMDRTLFGSTTQRVVGEAPCGVMVVHEPRGTRPMPRPRAASASSRPATVA